MDAERFFVKKPTEWICQLCHQVVKIPHLPMEVNKWLKELDDVVLAHMETHDGAEKLSI